MLVHRFIVRRHFAKHSAKHFRRSFHKHAIPHLSFLRLPQSPRVFHFTDHRHASIRALKPVPEHRREASRALASHPLGRRQRPRSRREIPSAMLQRGEFHLIPEQLRGREREKRRTFPLTQTSSWHAAMTLVASIGSEFTEWITPSSGDSHDATPRRINLSLVSVPVLSK